MGAKRGHGTGHVYVKHGAYYGRWRTSDDRLLNRRLSGERFFRYVYAGLIATGVALIAR